MPAYIKDGRRQAESASDALDQVCSRTNFVQSYDLGLKTRVWLMLSQTYPFQSDSKDLRPVPAGVAAEGGFKCHA